MSTDGGPEPMSDARPTSSTDQAEAQEVPLPVRVQMMATEHWSLLASRNLAWNESFTRASMFLSTLSFAVVALALVGQATGFGEEFRLFALVVLPVILFLGVATSLRMDSANHHDALCVIGMNRIRAGYLELAPDLERFFVMGATDDVEGIVRTMAVFPHRSRFWNLVGASPTLVVVLNAVLVGAILSLVAMQLALPTATSLAFAAIGFGSTIGVWTWTTRRMLLGVMAEHRPLFPGPPGGSGDSLI